MRRILRVEGVSGVPALPGDLQEVPLRDFCELLHSTDGLRPVHLRTAFGSKDDRVVVGVQFLRTDHDTLLCWPFLVEMTVRPINLISGNHGTSTLTHPGFSRPSRDPEVRNQCACFEALATG